jgi:anti-anti-sigma factor
MIITVYEPSPPTAMGLTLHGDLDIGGAAELRRCLPALLARHQPLHVNLDLAHVTFLDCSGARSLTWLDRCVRGHGGTLTIVRPSPLVIRLLRLLELDRRLRISQEDRHDDVPPGNWRIIRFRSLYLDPAPSLN